MNTIKDAATKLGRLIIDAAFAEAKSPKAVALERALLRAVAIYVATKVGISLS
jgi:hypothetical protein